jgi:hypothetical protein
MRFQRNVKSAAAKVCAAMTRLKARVLEWDKIVSV